MTDDSVNYFNYLMNKFYVNGKIIQWLVELLYQWLDNTIEKNLRKRKKYSTEVIYVKN